MSGTLYDILEIPIGSKEIAIKRAYRRLSFKHHPDTGDGNLEALQKIKDAYERLSDAEKRAKYDAILGVLEEQKKVQEQEDDPWGNKGVWNIPRGNPMPFIPYGYSGSSPVGYAKGYVNSGSVGYYGSYGSMQWGTPKASIAFRIDDVAKFGLTGLTPGQTVYISVSGGYSGGSYTTQTITMFLTAPTTWTGTLKKGILTQAHYGVAPGLPVYGDFEVEF